LETLAHYKTTIIDKKGVSPEVLVRQGIKGYSRGEIQSIKKRKQGFCWRHFISDKKPQNDRGEIF